MLTDVCALIMACDTATQEAVGLFRQRMLQFNGCVPYAGVSTATRVDEAVLPVLFALLPVPQPVGITIAPPSVKARQTPCFEFWSLHLTTAADM